jgi:DNA-directed RNA polymerase specialized sigma24 family protein
MSDEELVDRARHCPRAEAALLERHGDWITRVVVAEVRRQRLPRADWSDALLEGRFALHEAVGAYKAPPPGQAGEGCFPAFLRLVVTARVRDLARRLRGQERHHSRSVRVGTRPPGGTPARGGSQVFEPATADGDPARLAERSEAVRRLESSLAGLDPTRRRLVETLTSEESLRAAARELRLSYGVAKRLRQKVVADLRAQLRDVVE